jgi:NAD-dependent SIR2 family protein deacetylase
MYASPYDGEAVNDFTVPPCAACSAGPLKPAVVFFGDNVPPAVAAAAKSASESADAVLIIGSSVSTFSAFRLVKAAADRGVPVAILTAVGWRSLTPVDRPWFQRSTLNCDDSFCAEWCLNSPDISP